MAITDIFIGVGIAATVVAAGVGGWALRGWWRRLEAYRAYKDEREFQEQDAAIINDIKAYPFLQDQTQRLEQEVMMSWRAGRPSQALAESLDCAKRFQDACEQRLRAAGYEIVCGEVA